MVNETKAAGAAASAGASSSLGGGGGGFRAKMVHYLYSGEPKHVLGGMVIVGVLFGVPWYYMNRGSKHQSHQDYMEKADRARNDRLSTGSPAAKISTGN